MNSPLLIFDGVCNLCNSSIRFILQHDKNKTFRFSTSQSEFSKNLLVQKNITLSDLSSVILFHNDKFYLKSTAVLRIAKLMNWPFKLLYLFIVVPYPIRDFIYSIISRNRYKWFGKKDKCMVASDELKEQFIE